MRLGKVICIGNTPNCEKFYFVAENPIKRGMLVEVKTGEGKLVGRVYNVIKTNRYFMNAEVVKNFGEEAFFKFPLDRWEYLIAEVNCLGLVKDGEKVRVVTPPSPGEEVFEASPSLIKDFFGFSDDGLKIGSVFLHNVEVRLNLSKLFQKHLAILAVSGAGKSYLASTLIEELLKRDISPAIIVIDPHGEYKSFKLSKEFSEKTKIFGREQIKIDTSKLSALNFSEFLPQMSIVQRRDLERVIEKLKEVKKNYGIEELMQAIELSDINSKTKFALLSWLSTLASTKLFSNFDSPSFEDLASPNQLSVIDLSDFIKLREKQIIVTYIARKLFEARRSNKIPPVIMFIEEAHQFVPQIREREFAISREIIETIAREGRKFNFSLVLISQRPIRLSTTALSQCNTFIVLRIVNPYDIRHICESCEAMTSEIASMLPGLRVGEAFIIGEAVNYPVLIKVRKRISKEIEDFGRFEKCLMEFVNEKNRVKEDLEAFK